MKTDQQLVKKDSRLLFFRALEKGLKSGVIKNDFLQELKKEAADMTVHLAGRFYSVIYEAYIRDSANIVLGIVSLGLAKESNVDLEKAVSLILSNGMVGLFRLGWTMIARLAELVAEAGDLRSEETDFGEFEFFPREIRIPRHFVAEPNDDMWEGDQEYDILMKKYQHIVSINKFKSGFVNQYKSLRESSSEARIAYSESKKFNTLLFSLYIKNKPYRPIKLRDCIKMTLKKKNLHDFERRIENIKTTFSEENLALFEECYKNFKEDTEQLRMTLDEGNLNELVEQFPIILDVELDLAEYDKDLFEEAEKYFAKLGRKELLESIEYISDKTMRLALTRRLARLRSLTSEEILTIVLNMDKDEWINQIPWHKVSWKNIAEALSSEELGFKEKDFLADVFRVFTAQKKGKWKENIPLGMAFRMFWAIEKGLRLQFWEELPCLDGLRERIGVSKNFQYLPLAKLEDWYEIWTELGNTYSSELFSFLTNKDCFQWSSRQEMIEHLTKIVLAITSEWQKIDVCPSESQEFFSDLQEAVKKILSSEEIDALTIKLDERMKK